MSRVLRQAGPLRKGKTTLRKGKVIVREDTQGWPSAVARPYLVMYIYLWAGQTGKQAGRQRKLRCGYTATEASSFLNELPQ